MNPAEVARVRNKPQGEACPQKPTSTGADIIEGLTNYLVSVSASLAGRSLCSTRLDPSFSKLAAGPIWGQTHMNYICHVQKCVVGDRVCFLAALPRSRINLTLSRLVFIPGLTETQPITFRRSPPPPSASSCAPPLLAALPSPPFVVSRCICPSRALSRASIFLSRTLARLFLPFDLPSTPPTRNNRKWITCVHARITFHPGHLPTYLPTNPPAICLGKTKSRAFSRRW